MIRAKVEEKYMIAKFAVTKNKEEEKKYRVIYFKNNKLIGEY